MPFSLIGIGAYKSAYRSSGQCLAAPAHCSSEETLSFFGTSSGRFGAPGVGELCIRKSVQSLLVSLPSG